MRSWVRDARSTEWLHDGNRRKAKNGEGQNENRQHGHLDVIGLDFLAEVLWSPANHQPCDENRKDDKHHDAVEASAHSAENNFPYHDIDQRDHAAKRRKRIVLA